MKNVHVLPTTPNNKATSSSVWSKEIASWSNIYITNDEEIKAGEWCFEMYNGKSKATSPNFIDKKGNRWWLRQMNMNCLANDTQCKKIIITTDQDLIKDGVQAIDDEFLEWFVKNPSCERIEVNGISDVALGGFADVYYKIIIPRTTQQIIDEDYAGGLEMGQIPAKEEPKQEFPQPTNIQPKKKKRKKK
jgi:hypothetical protein